MMAAAAAAAGKAPAPPEREAEETNDDSGTRSAAVPSLGQLDAPTPSAPSRPFPTSTPATSHWSKNGLTANLKAFPAVQILVQRRLTWFLDEASWQACSALNQACSLHYLSRYGLRPLAHGLPDYLEGCEGASARRRRRVWRRLCLGAMDLGDQEYYRALAAKPSPADAEIRRDIGRTFPEKLDEEAQEALFRVLRAVSHRLEDVGYCQGMNFVAGVFLRIFSPEDEALVFQCVVALMLRHGMNQYFGDRFPKLRLTSLQFDILVEAFFPNTLAPTFDHFNLSAEFYATQWFLTLFCYSLPFGHVVKIWDHFLCWGMKFIHRVGLALLQDGEADLIDRPFDATLRQLRFLGDRTKMTPDELVKSALEFKVTCTLLSDLEHALAAGSADASSTTRALPLCVLERDLDSGRSKWRAIAAAPSGAATGAVVSGAAGEDWCVAEGSDFLDAHLPAPRVPADPSMKLPDYFLTAPAPPQPSSASPEEFSKRRKQRLKVLKAVPKVVIRKLKKSSKGSHAEESSIELTQDQAKACNARSGVGSGAEASLSPQSSSGNHGRLPIPPANSSSSVGSIHAASAEPPTSSSTSKSFGGKVGGALSKLHHHHRSSSVPSSQRQKSAASKSSERKTSDEVGGPTKVASLPPSILSASKKESPSTTSSFGSGIPSLARIDSSNDTRTDADDHHLETLPASAFMVRNLDTGACCHVDDPSLFLRGGGSSPGAGEVIDDDAAPTEEGSESGNNPGSKSKKHHHHHHLRFSPARHFAGSLVSSTKKGLRDLKSGVSSSSKQQQNQQQQQQQQEA